MQKKKTQKATNASERPIVYSDGFFGGCYWNSNGSSPIISLKYSPARCVYTVTKAERNTGDAKGRPCRLIRVNDVTFDISYRLTSRRAFGNLELSPRSRKPPTGPLDRFDPLICTNEMLNCRGRQDSLSFKTNYIKSALSTALGNFLTIQDQACSPIHARSETGPFIH